MTAAAAAFRSLVQTAANGVPVPLTSVRFQRLKRQCVGLHLIAPLPGRPVLLPPSAATGDAFSSDGEDYSEEDEEYLEEEAEEVEAPPAYSSPQSRPPRGQEPGRLFVGNLLYTMTSAELSEAFCEAGRVDDAQVPALKPNRNRKFFLCFCLPGPIIPEHHR
jgi:nucleolin